MGGVSCAFWGQFRGHFEIDPLKGVSLRLFSEA